MIGASGGGGSNPATEFKTFRSMFSSVSIEPPFEIA
jgi:hypothetical protein